MLTALPCGNVLVLKLTQDLRRSAADDDTGRDSLVLFHHCALSDNGVFADIGKQADYRTHADVSAVSYVVSVDYRIVAYSDPLAELHTLLGVLDRLIDRILRHADAYRRDAEPAGVESGHRRMEAPADLAEQILLGNTDIVENDLGNGACTHAHEILVAADGYALALMNINEQANGAFCAVVSLRIKVLSKQKTPLFIRTDHVRKYFM